MPSRKPSTVPRATGPALAFRSSFEGHRLPMRDCTMSRRTCCSMLVRISATPNRPITTGMRPIPSTSSRRSKVSRGMALIWSRPTRPMTTPTAAINSAFAIEP